MVQMEVCDTFTFFRLYFFRINLVLTKAKQTKKFGISATDALIIYFENVHYPIKKQSQILIEKILTVSFPLRSKFI